MHVGVQIVLVNPLDAELNLICNLLALLGAHHNIHVSRVRAKCAGHAEGRWEPQPEERLLVCLVC